MNSHFLTRPPAWAPLSRHHASYLLVFESGAPLVSKASREALLHALAYATRDRKQRKRDFRGLWIARGHVIG